jgi:endonuclease YncB( thermonuclease family)
VLTELPLTVCGPGRDVDGNTIDVQFDNGWIERCRLVGVDTPELVDLRKPVQCYGREASANAMSCWMANRSQSRV